MLFDDKGDDGLFLPDFCGVRMVLVVVVLAELLALVFALVSEPLRNFWQALALVSLYVQWIALCGTGALCAGRRVLVSLDNAAAGLLAYTLLLAVAALCAEAAWWLAPDVRALYLSDQQHAGFVLRTLLVTAIVAALALRYLFVQYQWRTNERSEWSSRVQALQSRIRPHFLFNSLNTVASLVGTEPAAAEQAVLDLADMFRASLADAGTRVALADELALCEQYMNIEKLRLGERLTFEIETAQLPVQTLIPPLTIQPLLENAVYHGIEILPEGGVIRLYGNVEKGAVRVTVENTAAGQTANPVNGAGHDGNHLAQDNIRQRLVAWYGPAGSLAVEAVDGLYRVSIGFPEDSA